MILVEPMPNELAAGHQGRFGWVNGCRNEVDLAKLIKGALGQRGLDSDQMSRLNQLGVISNMECSDYVHKHSLIGAYRVAAPDGDAGAYGTGSVTRNSKRPGMPQSRHVTAYSCSECVVEDMQRFGFSWFRRFHHLACVDWCVVHSTKLSSVNDRMPFSRMPHIWLEKNKLEPLKVAIENLPADGFLRRFVDISCLLLERGQPFLLKCIHGALARQAFKIGLNPARHGRRPYVSDHLCAQADSAWLAGHVPDWHLKLPIDFFPWIDSAVTVTTKPVTGAAYAMAMAALYGTSTEAMQYVGLAEETFEMHPGTAYWTDKTDEQSYYFQEAIKPIAERLNRSYYHSARAFELLGLPNTHERRPSDAWAVLIRFLYGESIRAACLAEQVDKNDVRALLRKCSGNVMPTLKYLRREFLLRLAPSTNRRELVYIKLS